MISQMLVLASLISPAVLMVRAAPRSTEASASRDCFVPASSGVPAAFSSASVSVTSFCVSRMVLLALTLRLLTVFSVSCRVGSYSSRRSCNSSASLRMLRSSPLAPESADVRSSALFSREVSSLNRAQSAAKSSMTRPVGLAILSMVVYRPLCRSLICLVALSNPPAIRSMAAPPTLSDSPGVAAVEPPVSPLPPSAPVSPPSVVVALLSPVVTLPAPVLPVSPSLPFVPFSPPSAGADGVLPSPVVSLLSPEALFWLLLSLLPVLPEPELELPEEELPEEELPEPVILPLLLPALVFEPASEPPPDGLSLPEGLPPTLSLPELAPLPETEPLSEPLPSSGSFCSSSPEIVVLPAASVSSLPLAYSSQRSAVCLASAGLCPSTF